MKNAIGLALIVGVLFGVYKLWELYDQQTTTRQMEVKDTRHQEFGSHLQGLDQRLEQVLREAYGKGVLGLKAFLRDYSNTPYLKDPRLAWIEIDYAVMLVNKDPKQALEAFAEVKNRVPPNSPVMPRIKELERAFKGP
ncbi:MAG: hypothetical protein HYR88_14600 [Verrucomicrobia bacterium]|nr:hypothetical protein [Verrucomicrobiota bacterium]MBI3867927.1 hypothetical protein [Verrucomicrobiota bacterium]